MWTNINEITLKGLYICYPDGMCRFVISIDLIILIMAILILIGYVIGYKKKKKIGDHLKPPSHNPI